MRPPPSAHRSFGGNRRKYPRLVGPYLGEWCLPDGPAQKGRVGQISLGGCYVSAMQPPGPGQRVIVTIDTGAASSVPVAGTVVRSTWSNGLGVKFDALEPQQADRFRALLESIRARAGSW